MKTLAYDMKSAQEREKFSDSVTLYKSTTQFLSLLKSSVVSYENTQCVRSRWFDR